MIIIILTVYLLIFNMDNKTTKQLLEVKQCSHLILCWIITIALTSLFLIHGLLCSTPESLGRVWKVHLWHDNGGSSPSWYLSHVVVRDLVQGSCWFFLGQCWLAVDEGDGDVERSLNATKHSLTFKQV